MDKEIIKLENLITEDKPGTNEKQKFNYMKLFTGKNLKIILLIAVFIVCLILYLKFSKSTDTSNSTVTSSTSNYQTTLEYSNILEQKLEEVLSQIKGAGNVKVMITLDGSPELVYANDVNEKTSNTQNGATTTSSSTPIIVDTKNGSSPLILTEKLPKVKGVIVVSTGAQDVSIKLDILNSVSTLLDISRDKINVLKGI